MSRKPTVIRATGDITHYPLNEAWFYFALAEQRESYRQRAETPAEFELLSIDMKRHLIDQLASGELEASGVQTAPIPSSQREHIPKVLFEQAAIDWEGSTIEGYGRRIEGVRVHGTSERNPRPLAAPRGEGLSQLQQATSAAKNAEKTGRPRILPIVTAIARSLLERNAFDGLSRKDQENAVRDACQAQKDRFPTPLKKHLPSRETIRKALTAIGVIGAV
jgi:hypothetical protein